VKRINCALEKRKKKPQIWLIWLRIGSFAVLCRDG
jgi:hypothetical protein